MKKKLMAVLLGSIMALSLAACGSSKAGFTDDDLVFKDGSKEFKVELNYHLEMYSDYCLYENLADYDDWEESESDYATARGLAIGMTLDDYKELYAVKNGYALWELRDYDDYSYGYTSRIVSYTNESPAAIYDEYDDVADAAWLFLGWCKENGEWRTMTDEEVYDVWYCEANYSDFSEVAILFVGLSYYDEVAGLEMYHFTYDKVFEEWQGWEW